MMEQEDEVLAKARQLRAAGVPLAEIEKYVASKRQPQPAVPRESLKIDIPKESTVARSESTKGLSRSRPGASGDFQSLTSPGQGKVLTDEVLPGIASLALTTAQGIPGMERGEAFMGSMGSKLTDHPMTYQESLATLRDKGSEIPSDLRTTLKVAGSAPLAAFKPLQAMSAAKGGAAIGAADQLLSADDMSMGERAGRTALGAAAGATIGKTLEMGVTGGRVLGAKNSAANLFEKEAARAASAKRLYDAANAEGHAAQATQAVQTYLAEPEIAELVTKLQTLDEFKNVAPDSPEMLDAIYKTLSDNAKTVGKALEAADPSKLNTGRFRLQEIKNQKNRLLAAMSSPDKAVKPALTFDVPAEVVETAPRVTPGREGVMGAPPSSGPLESYTSSGTGRKLQGPAGPAFRMPQVAEQVRPGVRIETPAMRVTTAPEEVTDVPAMMPSYKEAVEDYARRTAEMKALMRGQDAIKERMGSTVTSGKNLTRTTPEEFRRWIQQGGDRAAPASEGVMGGTREAFDKAGIRKGLRAVSRAPDLLRGTSDQAIYDLITRLALTSGNAITPY